MIYIHSMGSLYRKTRYKLRVLLGKNTRHMLALIKTCEENLAEAKGELADEYNEIGYCDVDINRLSNDVIFLQEKLEELQDALAYS